MYKSHWSCKSVLFSLEWHTRDLELKLNHQKATRRERKNWHSSIQMMFSQTKSINGRFLSWYSLLLAFIDKDDDGKRKITLNKVASSPDTNIEAVRKYKRSLTMLNLKWVQPEAKSLPDTLLLALDDNSMWSRAPLQPEAKLLPDDHSLTLDDQVKRAPVPDQRTHHFRKRFNFLYETLCLLWLNEATRVFRCVVST